jgi:hypothetical protein
MARTLLCEPVMRLVSLRFTEFFCHRRVIGNVPLISTGSDMVRSA